MEPSAPEPEVESEPVQDATGTSKETHLKKARIRLGRVLNITWKSEGRPEDAKWTLIKLSVPSPDEECPITQGLMSAAGSDLDFLPGVSFRKEDPEYKRIELSCGHAFSAMCLTYHFFKNGMLCPLCRAGHEETLAPLCVPQHFRREMQQRLVNERAQDRAEADRDNLASAILAQEASYHTLLSRPGILVQRIHLMMPRDTDEGMEVLRMALSESAQTEEEREADRLETFLQHHRMCLSVYAYEREDLVAPVSVMEFPMDMWALPPTARNTAAVPQPLGPSARAAEPDRNNLNIRLQRREGEGPDPSAPVLAGSLQRQSLRELGRNLQGFQHPLMFRFVLGTRSLSNSVVELARTGLVDLEAPDPVAGAFGGSYVPSSVPGIGFEIRHFEGRDDRPRELDSVVWYTAQHTFLNFALECILQGQRTQWQRLVQHGSMQETIIVID